MPEKKFLSIELDERLVEEQIVNRYFYDFKTSGLVLNLNHQYNDKVITSTLELEEWGNSVKEFKENMTVQDISPAHIMMILDTLAVNYQRISEYVKNQKKNKNKKAKREANDDENRKREFMAFKYSNEGKDDLHEVVILAGKPAFLKYDSNANKIMTVPKIVEEVRTIAPPHGENYPAYTPYEFSSLDEVADYLERARLETIDSLYLQAKKIASDYNDQTDEQISLLAIEIVCSYSQDRFPTVHYDIVTGGNGSGKSAYGITFVSVGYRPAYLMDINAANIFRILGCVEIGQCTLVLDEAEKICDNPDLVSILKSGYSPIGRISRVNDFSRQPEFFHPFCFKVILAESIPNIREAKGFRDRSFEWPAFRGSPKFDIKEDLEADIQGNVEGQRRLSRLIDFRKLMLIYRLLHFRDSFPDIDLGFVGREKELVKPTIQIFYGSQVQREVEATLEHFLNLRNEGKDSGLEAALYPMVWELVLASKTGKIYHKDLWGNIISGAANGGLDGVFDSEHKPNEYQSEDYGTIYRNQIGTILEQTFGGRRIHTKRGNVFIFDPPMLAKVGKSYNLRNKIKTCLIAGASLTGNNSHSWQSEGEPVTTVNALEKAYEAKNNKKECETANNSPYSRGDLSSNNVKKGGGLSLSRSPRSPVHPQELEQQQEPDFDSVAEGLSDIYD